MNPVRYPLYNDLHSFFYCYVVCNYAAEMKIDTIAMGRRGMSNMERWLLFWVIITRVLNGSVSSYVLANAPCAYSFILLLTSSVCLMGKAIEDRIKMEQLDKEIQDVISASSSEGENDGEKKMPFFLPRKHSTKNYYSDSD